MSYHVERYREGTWLFQQECCCRDTACRIACECGSEGRPCRVVKPENGATIFQSDQDEYEPTESAK